MSSDTRENRWLVNSELSFLAQYHFTTLVQTVSKCGEIQNNNSYSDKIPDVLIYGLLRFHEIQYNQSKVTITCERWITRKSLFSVQWVYCFTTLVQRVFICDKFKTPVLLQMKYWTVWYMDHIRVIIHTSYKLLKWCVFMAHPVQYLFSYVYMKISSSSSSSSTDCVEFKLVKRLSILVRISALLFTVWNVKTESRLQYKRSKCHRSRWNDRLCAARLQISLCTAFESGGKRIESLCRLQ